MYISKISITNFRNFKNSEISFNDGINVVVGHNNAGKTNLLKALALVIDSTTTRRLTIDDFNKMATIHELKSEPPKIQISLNFKKGKNESPDDLPTISNWLITLDSDYEALLTYEFFLPEKEKQRYLDEAQRISDTDTNAIGKLWKTIETNFIRFYTHKTYGGSLINQAAADPDSIHKFDYQFLDAIRDTERDLLTGKNALLKEVFDFFIDYDIKSILPLKMSVADKQIEIDNRKLEFSEKADALIDILQNRLKSGKNQILSYARATGASFNDAEPNFQGSISDSELYSVLKLIVEYKSGMKIPATHNGLGYNNLIYMSLLLAKMQVDSNGDYMGGNAKIFPILAIEEPEAHLHPGMQKKFLSFLRENISLQKVRQIFITSHSTHITSTVDLDELICLSDINGSTSVGYPGRALSGDPKKGYVQRFIDATKSDILFANKVILVEGIAEQLLIPAFAKLLGVSLEDKHISIVSIGGRHFSNFELLFSEANPSAIHKRIACITDLDPERRLLQKEKFEKCYPFEYANDSTKYEYQNNLPGMPNGNPSNIRYFTQNVKFGKTLEYEIAFLNPSSKHLLTPSIKNYDELDKLIDAYVNGETAQELIGLLRSSDENARIVEGINGATNYSDDEKRRAIIASRYLNSVTKGENALELASQIFDIMSSGQPAGAQILATPIYIEEALNWIIQ